MFPTVRNLFISVELYMTEMHISAHKDHKKDIKSSGGRKESIRSLLRNITIEKH